MASLFGGIFKKKAAPVQAQATPFQLIWTGHGFSMIPAEILSYIQKGYAANSVVYQVVTALMDKFSSVPFAVYDVKNEKKLSAYKMASTHSFSDHVLHLKAQALEETSENNPISILLHKPNSYQTEAEFKKMCLMFLKLTGMSAVWANKGGVGTKPLSLNPLPSQWVTLQADASLMDVAKVWFSPYGAGSNELTREDVYLWRYANPDWDVTGSHLYGLSPLKAGLMDVKSSNEASKQMAKMYENGGARGVFTPKQIINEIQVNDFRSSIETWLTGSDNRGKVGGLGAPVEYHNIGLDAVDMALLEGKNITDERIAGIYNYPPALLKSDNKFDNANAAVKYVVTNSIYCDLVAYRDMWNQFIIPMFGSTGKYYIDFDISVLPEMQEDMKRIIDQVKEMWWLTPDEMRAVTKYGALGTDAMNAIYIPTSRRNIEDAFLPTTVPITEDYAQPK